MTKVSPTNLLSQAESTNGLRDIKPPVEIPNYWIWLVWILSALVLAALLWWAWKKWTNSKPPGELEMIVPAHVRARHRLRQALLFMDNPKEFCTRVSDAIRAYLEERFDLHAPERTTEEFLNELQQSPALNLEQRQSLSAFLERCDLVKFARYEPAEPELRDLYGSALRLVEQTELQPGTDDAGQRGSNEQGPPGMADDKGGPRE